MSAELTQSQKELGFGFSENDLEFWILPDEDNEDEREDEEQVSIPERYNNWVNSTFFSE